ncbi:MAG TPA: ABC transporter permease [Firmicutes bacterium]|jgi:ribose/xylose/arabinose/galactoside ABC-type transport system permease subunit|nr:ABC transporter permease [Bacillota bacterium]
MKKFKTFILDNVTLIGLLTVIFIGALISPTFLSLQNTSNLLRSASIMGLVSVGMTFVILCGSIDLSVSSVFSLSCYFFIVLSRYSVILAILVPLAVGILVGLANGFLINKMSIPAFVGTLATMLFVRGLVLVLCNNVTVNVGSLPPVLNYIGRGVLLQYISFPLILFILTVLIAAFILKKRFIGRTMYIVGGNAEAAKMMGVSVQGTLYTAHALSGLMAAMAGIIFASRVGSSYPLAGNGYELYAIASVVIGGAALTGGIGKMTGTLFGSLIMGSFSNIFKLQRYIDPQWEFVMIGTILLAVVIIQSFATIYGSARRKSAKVYVEQMGNS